MIGQTQTPYTNAFYTSRTTLRIEQLLNYNSVHYKEEIEFGNEIRNNSNPLILLYNLHCLAAAFSMWFLLYTARIYLFI